MPSVCTVSTTGHAAAWPDGLPGDEHRELADEVDPLLEEQAAARADRARRPGEPVGEVVGGRTTRTPLPS